MENNINVVQNLTNLTNQIKSIETDATKKAVCILELLIKEASGGTLSQIALLNELNNVKEMLGNLTISSKVPAPKITNFKEMVAFKDQIVKYVEQNRDQDVVYHFAVGPKYEVGNFGKPKENAKLDPGFYIAGSAALPLFIDKYAEINRVIRKDMAFQPNDTDIFILNSPIKHRSTTGYKSGIDLVFTKDKTIEDLLLNFDLPCCRVATNGLGGFWVSIQCMAAIMTGVYYLPNYLKDYNKFKALIAKYPGHALQGLTNNAIDHQARYLFDRLINRLIKYSTRGFNYTLYETETVLPWIIHRLDYSEPTGLLESRH